MLRPGQHAHPVPHPAARPKVPPLARAIFRQSSGTSIHGMNRGYQQRQPEKRAAQQVERVELTNPLPRSVAQLKPPPCLMKLLAYWCADLLVIENARVME